MLLKKSLTQNKLLKALFITLMVAYPFMVFAALCQGISLRVLSLLFLLVLCVQFINARRWSVFLGGLCLVLLLFIFQNELFLKAYPVLTNSLLALTFLLSLKSTPAIEHFARKMNVKMTKDKRAYCRKATLAWGVFLSINALISFATVFASIEVWTLYNGFISYILIGLMAASEFVARKRTQKCL